MVVRRNKPILRGLNSVKAPGIDQSEKSRGRYWEIIEEEKRNTAMGFKIPKRKKPTISELRQLARENLAKEGLADNATRIKQMTPAQFIKDSKIPKAYFNTIIRHLRTIFPNKIPINPTTLEIALRECTITNPKGEPTRLVNSLTQGKIDLLMQYVAGKNPRQIKLIS